MFFILLTLLSIERYIKAKQNSNKVCNSTLKAYKSDLIFFYEWFCENNYEELTVHTVNSYLEYLHTKNMELSTIRRKYTVLKSFLNVEYVDLSAKIKFHFETPSLKYKFLSDEEVNIFFEAVYSILEQSETKYKKSINSRDTAILELIFCTGASITSVSGLKNEDVDIKNKGVYLNGYFVKMNERMLTALSLWIKNRDVFSNNSDYIFVNKYGNKLSIYGLENIFYKYRNLSGLDNKFTINCLRHTFAINFLRQNNDLVKLKNILGHNSISTTSNYLNVLNDFEKQKMIQ